MVQLGDAAQMVKSGLGIALMETERAGLSKYCARGRDWITQQSALPFRSVSILEVTDRIGNDGTASRLGSLRILLVRRRLLSAPISVCHPKIRECSPHISGIRQEMLTGLIVQDRRNSSSIVLSDHFATSTCRPRCDFDHSFLERFERNGNLVG